MDIIKTIRAEINKLYDEYKDKFHQCGDQYHLGLIDGLDMAERVLDTLQEQDRPDPYNPTYDEAYLNEKITKASKTWKGVDVDKYMNEVRGREPEVDLDSKVTFDCISKKVTMTIRELINYYIDRECCDVAEECGF